MTEHHKPSLVEAQELADACAKAMYSRDHAAQALGITIVNVRPGYALLSMMVRKDMVNGYDICHGGMLFTLADTAFAYSCNSYNKATVASACHIDFLAPGMLGATLSAEGVERWLSGRTGVYDVTIRDESGKVLALFRGKSHRLNGDVMTGLQ
jgi:acyl-CoA thioesterase